MLAHGGRTAGEPVASLIGMWGMDALVDRQLCRVTLIRHDMFAAAALLHTTPHGSAVLMLAGVAVWGLTSGGAQP